MKACISPSTCKGMVAIPASKSMAHRAIIAASLAKGVSTIDNITFSQDILATIACMRQLGATITIESNRCIVSGMTSIKHQDEIIDANESGSTLRFLIPIFSLCDHEVIFTGSKRLLERPLSIYETIYHNQQLQFIQKDGHLITKGKLKPDTYHIPGNISSQFISGLLFTLPLLEKPSIIKIMEPFESSSYVSLTIEMLKRYHINIEKKDDFTFYIPANQTYQATNYQVEGDYSQFAFFAVYAAIAGTLTITNVNHNSHQGDKQILTILKDFHVKIEEVENGYKIYQSELIAHDIDLQNCPDLGPILCVLAMYAKGKTTIRHATRLRIKESDRIAAMETELQKFGVSISSSYDEIEILGNTNYTCTKPLEGHNDHRIVMALAIASACSQSETTILDAQAIAKSYPTFFDDFSTVKGLVKCYDI